LEELGFSLSEMFILKERRQKVKLYFISSI